MAKYTHSKGSTTVTLDMPNVAQAMQNLGIDQQGAVQKFATRRAKERMDKYTPRREGVLIETAEIRDTEIEYVQPYARHMYFGIDMRTGRPWNYTGAPQRGGFWDERMMAAEGDQLTRDIQAYSDKLTKGE